MKSARAWRAPPKRRTKLATEQSVRFIVSCLRAKDPCYLRQLSWEDREFPIDRTICMLDVNDYSSTVRDFLGPPWPSRRRRELVAFLASDRAASTRGRPLPLPAALRIMEMVQYDKFNPEGLSGAPVLTADNKVIGTMLAAAQDGDMRQRATSANIRKR